MSAQLTFWYKRFEKVPKTDEKGKQIGVNIIECEDCLNLYDVLRGFWKDGNIFCLMMKDGHEETREVDLPQHIKDQMKQNKKIIPKEKGWFNSQVDLYGLDIYRYRLATELILPDLKKEELPEIMRPHILEPPPQPQVKTEPIETQPSEPITSGMSIVREEPEVQSVTEEVTS